MDARPSPCPLSANGAGDISQSEHNSSECGCSERGCSKRGCSKRTHRQIVNKNQKPPPISEEIKRTWRRTRLDTSSGGVPFRVSPTGQIDVALIATRGGTRWQLPKGSRETGETSLQTAIREVEEEVGLITTMVCFLETIDFWYWDTYRKEVPELVHKRVDFFLLRVVDGVISDESHEVDSVGWFPIAQALEILTFSGERRVARAAMTRLAACADPAADSLTGSIISSAGDQDAPDS